ncbi:MAG: hypothetical protein WB919_18935 [Candidatus Sulfotelmatobacter sp.]
MRAVIEQVEPCESFSGNAEAHRLRVVVADGSPQYMDTVLALLEFHEIIDLIGRAANFEEVIELAVNHQPDMVLIDLEMPLASMAIPAITLATRARVKIVGMANTEFIASRALDVIVSVQAIVHKAHPQQELLPVAIAPFGSQMCARFSHRQHLTRNPEP